MSEIHLESQPTLPPEGEMTQLEQAFIEESPPGLWPDNQDSNFGSHRKVFCQLLQENYDELMEILANVFVDSANRWLYLWEYQLGLPTNPPGKTLNRRRARVRSHLLRGPFTNFLRNTIIENTIDLPVAGPVPEFSPAGIPFDLTSSDDSGIQLFAESAVTGAMYYVVEDVENFYYHVEIVDGVVYDPVVLRRELERITPAGISFDIFDALVKTGGAATAQSGGGPKSIV